MWRCANDGYAEDGCAGVQISDVQMMVRRFEEY
jgi:hypothetical protein